MINPDELRNWLLKEIDDAPLDAPEESVRDFARATVDAYLRTGRQFEVLTKEDDKAIVRKLSQSDR